MLAEALATRRTESGLRPFDLRRDLAALADLMELAFASEPDVMRSSVVTEMRRVAKAGPALWLLAASDSGRGSYMRGYVWTAGDRLVGNVTSSPDLAYRDLMVVSNVAVHPDFRRRGIAEQLLQATLEDAARRHVRGIVLEAQTENAAALELYRKFGFEVYDTVSELSLAAPVRGGFRNAALLSPRRSRHNDSLFSLLRETTPPTVQAVKPLRHRDYRLDIAIWFERFVDDVLYRRQSGDWVVEQGGSVSALLQMTGQFAAEAHRLRLVVHPADRGRLEEPLLAHGLAWLNQFPSRSTWTVVSSSHPQALQAFRQAGFQTLRVLDQMFVGLPRALRTQGDTR